MKIELQNPIKKIISFIDDRTPFPDYIYTVQPVAIEKSYDDLYPKAEEKLFQILTQMDNSNVILLGSEITLNDVTKIVLNKIGNKQYSNPLYNSFSILYFDVNEFTLQLSKEKEIKGIIEEFEFIARKLPKCGNVIIFIENIDKLLLDVDVCEMLRVLLGGTVRIIGTMKEKEKWSELLLTSDLVTDEFTVLLIAPEDENDLEGNNLRKYLGPTIKDLEDFHNSTFEEDAIRRAILLAQAFTSEDEYLRVSARILGAAISISKDKNHDKVSVEDVMNVLRADIEAMKKTDKDTLWRIAIHEAGHYVVYKHMKNLTDVKVSAITIIPSADALGFNRFWTKNVTLEDMDYIRDFMCISLGGRSAETVFFGKPSIGSSSDIHSIVANAYTSIAYGLMDEGLSTASTILSLISGDSRLSTDEDKKVINKKMDKLIDEEETRAKEIIETDKKTVEMIANALIERYLLSAKDISKLENS